MCARKTCFGPTAAILTIRLNAHTSGFTSYICKRTPTKKVSSRPRLANRLRQSNKTSASLLSIELSLISAQFDSSPILLFDGQPLARPLQARTQKHRLQCWNWRRSLSFRKAECLHRDCIEDGPIKGTGDISRTENRLYDIDTPADLFMPPLLPALDLDP